MSSRPTPETNEAKREGLMRGNPVPTQVVHVSFAERLEQQRDELHRAVQNHQGAINIAIESLDRAITQRDEARELARELRDALERLSNHGHADDCFLINRADGQCDCGVEDAQMLLHKSEEVLP